MKTNEKNFEVMNMTELRTELEFLIDAFNDSTDAEERIDLDIKHKKYVDRYNHLSLHDAYGRCLSAEIPIKALAEMYYYDTIKTDDKKHTEVINGIERTVVTRSINEGYKRLSLVKFIEWCEEANKTVTASKHWRSECAKARNEVIEQIKRVMNSNADKNAISYSKIKAAMQKMFDALVFIKAPSGKNAIVANGEIARWVEKFSTDRKDSRTDDGEVKITGTVMSKQKWAILQMDALNKVFTGKKFEIFYGDEVPEDGAEAEEENAEVEKPATEDDKQNKADK